MKSTFIKIITKKLTPMTHTLYDFKSLFAT